MSGVSLGPAEPRGAGGRVLPSVRVRVDERARGLSGRCPAHRVKPWPPGRAGDGAWRRGGAGDARWSGHRSTRSASAFPPSWRWTRDLPCASLSSGQRRRLSTSPPPPCKEFVARSWRAFPPALGSARAPGHGRVAVVVQRYGEVTGGQMLAAQVSERLSPHWDITVFDHVREGPPLVENVFPEGSTGSAGWTCRARRRGTRKHP